MNLPQSRDQKTIKRLWWAVFWVSFPFGVLGFLLPIYGRQLGASAWKSVYPFLIFPWFRPLSGLSWGGHWTAGERGRSCYLVSPVTCWPLWYLLI